jgi:hypothetical protein
MEWRKMPLSVLQISHTGQLIMNPSRNSYCVPTMFLGSVPCSLDIEINRYGLQQANLVGEIDL